MEIFERTAVSSDGRAGSTQDDDGADSHKRLIVSNGCSTL
jgi:hypothetical protein